MAASLRLVVLVCAVTAVFALDIKKDVFDEAQELSHNVEKRASKDQTVIFGAEGPNDKIIYHEFVNIPKGWFQVKKKDITYPPDASLNGPTITCIKVLDQLKTGKNAEIKLGSGGIGQKFAIINMKSKRGEPIMYHVYIYGR